MTVTMAAVREWSWSSGKARMWGAIAIVIALLVIRLWALEGDSNNDGTTAPQAPAPTTQTRPEPAP